jgi:REP element-mobilizing transposase RayT
VSDKFLGKYRIKSARLPGWNYAADGFYFVTICTKNRVNFFGEIREREMFLSPLGQIVGKFWRGIPAHFPNAKLDKFVVMPNHLHGILVIDNWGNGENHDDRRDEALPRLYPTTPPRQNFTTPPRLSAGKHPQMSKISPKPKSLSVIIGSFKSICTKHARRVRSDFAWQSRFHDQIIREEKNYNNIQNYILTNVANWKKDSENPQK